MVKKYPEARKTNEDDYKAARDTVDRLRLLHTNKGAKVKPAPELYKIKPKSPPAKRSKKQYQQEQIRKRGKGSSSGNAKSSGSKDVVVLSDVEGSEKKLRGRGEEPAVQHEPAVEKKLRGRGEEARVLSRSKRSRMPETVRSLMHV